MKELVDKYYKKIREQVIELEFLKKVQAASESAKEGYGGERTGS